MNASKALAVARGRTGCVTVKIDEMRCKLAFEKAKEGADLIGRGIELHTMGDEELKATVIGIF